MCYLPQKHIVDSDETSDTDSGDETDSIVVIPPPSRTASRSASLSDMGSIARDGNDADDDDDDAAADDDNDNATSHSARSERIRVLRTIMLLRVRLWRLQRHVLRALVSSFAIYQNERRFL